MRYISDRLVTLIEKNADQLTKDWLSEVRKNPATPTYHTYDEKALYKRAFDVYSRLSKWISKETTKEEIARHYIDLGFQRRRENFALSEVVQALILTRRFLWLKVLSEGFLDTALELYKALQLNNRVILYFDRAIYYITLGYETKD